MPCLDNTWKYGAKKMKNSQTKGLLLSNVCHQCAFHNGSLPLEIWKIILWEAQAEWLQDVKSHCLEDGKYLDPFPRMHIIKNETAPVLLWTDWDQGVSFSHYISSIWNRVLGSQRAWSWTCLSQWGLLWLHLIRHHLHVGLMEYL